MSLRGRPALVEAAGIEKGPVPLLDIDRMGTGQEVTGPILLVASDTTVVVPSGTRVSARPGGHLLVEID